MALITCPECGRQVAEDADHCTYCGYPLQSTPQESPPEKEAESPERNEVVADQVQQAPNSASETNEPQPDKRSRQRAYVQIAIGIVLIVAAVLLVTTHKYIYAINNISDIHASYEEALSLTTGFLGGAYATIAAEFKELYDQAVRYIVLHSIGAVVLVICGTVVIRRGLGRLRDANSLSALMKCPECGNQIADDVSICPHCGYPLPRRNAVTHHYKRNVWTVTIAAIVLIAVVRVVADSGSSSKTASRYGSSSSRSYSSSYSSRNSTPRTGNDGALAKAESYLSHTAFSYSGLIDQLEFEGFSESEATYGADHCGADWEEQALRKAESYLDHTAFSYSGLIDQLEFEGFTTDEAAYGADHCRADWKAQALRKAESYLEHSAFSHSGLIDQLEFEGFTTDEAAYGADYCGANWEEQARLKAESYLKYNPNMTRSSLIDQLEFEGFSYDQARYGVDQAGMN